jgi:hypothetical protein
MPVTYSINKFQTLHQLVQGMCYVLAYPVPADTTASTDSTHGRMTYAVNSAARELVQRSAGTYMDREASVSVSAAVAGDETVECDLPEDFDAMIPETWFIDGSLNPISPISQAGASDLLARGISTLTQYFRIANRKLIFYFPPSSPIIVRYSYRSAGHVIDQDTATLYKDNANKNGDIFLIDRGLLEVAARLKYAGWIGMDTRFLASEYQEALARVTNDDVAPVLGLPGATWGMAEEQFYGGRTLG